MELSPKKQRLVDYMDKIAARREYWIRKNKYYYDDLLKLLRYSIFPDSTILEIGCGTGYLLNRLPGRNSLGIDISSHMIEQAKRNYPHLRFLQMDAEKLALEEKFDYVLISDTLGYLEDIQQVLKKIRSVCHPQTRIIITYHNFLWLPVLSLAEILRLKMPKIQLNWLNYHDIANLLDLEGFESIRYGRRLLFPKFIPVFSWLANKYLAHLPLLRTCTLLNHIIARPLYVKSPQNDIKVSVIIPARNEQGNIENAIKRMPRLGQHTEIIFIEGHSTDGTHDEIGKISNQYGQWDIKYAIQDGQGKGDAVRKGFAMANGDLLMILDADLTVPPQELTKFYEVYVRGKGEYIQGSRLVYPMEKQAMRSLNLLANYFFSLMFSWLLGQPLKDTLCGTKVLSKENYQKLIENRPYFGNFDPFGDFDLIFGAAKLNLKMVEIPIRYQAREYGATNISRFQHGWLLLKMLLFAMNKIKFI